MAHHPIWRPDSTKPVESAPVPDPALPQAGPVPSSPSATENAAAAERQESDVAQWAAKFAAHGGGRIPAELSGELALDIVLNEVVEQAWLTTGATGAAIALVRDGEMVCRASGGVNAPELGTRLDTNSGLSGACVRTRQIQCCDDAFSDPRADAEASRDLGMRSVIVLPLLLDGELIGIFEIFSPRACAFGDHDLQTLQALAQRVLRNTKARQSPLVSIALPSPSFVSAIEEDASGGGAEKVEEIKEVREMAAPPELTSPPINDSPATHANAEATEVGVERRFDWVTSVMGGIIVAVALLMTMVFAVRVGWLKASGQRRAPRAATSASASSAKPATSAQQMNSSKGVPGFTAMPSGSAPNKAVTGQAEPHTHNGHVPEGSLRVFENGKEIFRMPPSDVEMAARPAKEENEVNADSTLKSAGIVELAPEAAQGSLVRRVEPQYPEQALAQRVQGPVVLDVHIGPQGEVMDIKVVSGDPLLVEAAIAAVKQWRFKSQMLNGRAVDTQTQITLKFTLPPG